MNKIRLIATAKYGLERATKLELIALGYDIDAVLPGRIEFGATPADIPHANLWLRFADRVRLKMGEFSAHTFDELFEQTKALPWETWITRDGKFTVSGKSTKSKLRSVPTCQSIVKKAIVERLKEAYGIEWFAESGPAFPVQIAMQKNVALLSIDTTGVGLHKRGYREEAGEAPLKESLAAALVEFSGWDRQETFLDPMCGSGTILIEAAMMAQNIAPGLRRSFVSEQWPLVPETSWNKARQAARDAARPNANLQLIGYDIDRSSLGIALENAYKAGVNKNITFTYQDVNDLSVDQRRGTLVTNPPYGMRIADFQVINQIYRTLNQEFCHRRGWSVCVLTADEKFPNHFRRSRPDRVQKLYNGQIEAAYFQYYGK